MLYHVGNTLPAHRQLPATFETVAVEALPLDGAEPALGCDEDGLWVLPGGGAEPYRPPALRAERVSSRSLIARACGTGVRVLDAMAGWGTDGLTLAALGCDVQLVERDPIVWALLSERHPAAALGDGFEWIGRGGWPVIYLDPMFAPRGRKGLAKQPLQVLQRLAAADQRSVADWLAHALAHAQDRVVLKQRAKAPPVGQPSWQIRGRSVRFDVYQPAARRAGTREG